MNLRPFARSANHFCIHALCDCFDGPAHMQIPPLRYGMTHLKIGAATAKGSAIALPLFAA
jgi:hypothetical protein